jgi:hypothetical protein
MGFASPRRKTAFETEFKAVTSPRRARLRAVGRLAKIATLMQIEVVLADGHDPVLDRTPRSASPVPPISFNGLLGRAGGRAQLDEVVGAVGPPPAYGESRGVARAPHDYQFCQDFRHSSILKLPSSRHECGVNRLFSQDFAARGG